MKANRAYKIIMPFAGFILIIAGIVNLPTNRNQILNIIQICSGSILPLLSIFQPIFYKKFGRLFISFGMNNLEIKRNYFKPGQNISWNEIAKIKFLYSKFIVYLKSNQHELITFEVPFSNIDEIRQ